MNTKTFATVGLRLLGVYFFVSGLPILPALALGLSGVPGFNGVPEDVYPHHTYFVVSAALQPPPITALTYLLGGVILLAASRPLGSRLGRGLDPDK